MIDQGENTSPQVRLVYKFDIYATSPVSRGDLYIDATTGAALYYNATIKHLGEYSHASVINGFEYQIKSCKSTLCIGKCSYKIYTQSIQTALSGSSYILSDVTRGNGVQTYNMKKELING
jgi:hypothetical protein